MSMRDYAVTDYGLVLDSNCLQILASKVIPNYSETEWDVSRDDIIEAVTDELDIQYIFGFTGETIPIRDDGIIDWTRSGYEPYDNDTVYYIGTAKYPGLFKAPYTNMEELVDEFRGGYKNYLPKDFDYRSRIRFISGTYCG